MPLSIRERVGRPRSGRPFACAGRGRRDAVPVARQADATPARWSSARARSRRRSSASVPLLINDRVDVALAAGADGVHVGWNDMAPQDARRLLGPDAIIGLTINSPARAECRAARPDRLCRRRRRLWHHVEGRPRSSPIGTDGLARVAAALRARAARLSGLRHCRDHGRERGGGDRGRRRRRVGDFRAVACARSARKRRASCWPLSTRRRPVGNGQDDDRDRRHHRGL